MMDSLPTLLSAFFVPFLISLALTWILIRWAPKLGLIDQPNSRKVHVIPTPKGGGLAVYFALALAQLYAPFRMDRADVLLGVGLVVVVLGLVDDRRPLPWQFRLAVQAAAAFAALALLGHIPGFTAAHSLSKSTLWLPWPVAVLWVVALTNAFNMLDNMDALSAGVAAIAAALFGVALACRADNWEATAPMSPATMSYVTLMGALAGFLWFNRPPARIFMGDAGSTFLGFLLGVRSLEDGLAEPGEPNTWLIPIGILFIAWYDMSTVVLLRLSQGRSPFHADKQHLSHRLVKLGMTSPAAVRIIHMMAAAIGAIAFVFYDVTSLGHEGAIFVVGVAWLALVGLEYVLHRRFLKGALEANEV
jgi:UDP-GlcNAc:undecaprenyl-phosphate GlcNAc-1-phosphate transferase